jgi:hypothetical protein
MRLIHNTLLLAAVSSLYGCKKDADNSDNEAGDGGDLEDQGNNGDADQSQVAKQLTGSSEALAKCKGNKAGLEQKLKVQAAALAKLEEDIKGVGAKLGDCKASTDKLTQDIEKFKQRKPNPPLPQPQKAVSGPEPGQEKEYIEKLISMRMNIADLDVQMRPKAGTKVDPTLEERKANLKEEYEALLDKLETKHIKLVNKLISDLMSQIKPDMDSTAKDLSEKIKAANGILADLKRKVRMTSRVKKPVKKPTGSLGTDELDPLENAWEDYLLIAAPKKTGLLTQGRNEKLLKATVDEIKRLPKWEAFVTSKVGSSTGELAAKIREDFGL